MIAPTNITLSKDKKFLTVTFKDNNFSMTSEYLRGFQTGALLISTDFNMKTDFNMEN